MLESPLLISWLLGSADLCLMMRESVSSTESHPNVSKLWSRHKKSPNVVKLSKVHF